MRCSSVYVCTDCAYSTILTSWRSTRTKSPKQLVWRVSQQNFKSSQSKKGFKLANWIPFLSSKLGKKKLKNECWTSWAIKLHSAQRGFWSEIRREMKSYRSDPLKMTWQNSRFAHKFNESLFGQFCKFIKQILGRFCFYNFWVVVTISLKYAMCNLILI